AARSRNASMWPACRLPSRTQRGRAASAQVGAWTELAPTALGAGTVVSVASDRHPRGARCARGRRSDGRARMPLHTRGARAGYSFEGSTATEAGQLTLSFHRNAHAPREFGYHRPRQIDLDVAALPVLASQSLHVSNCVTYF